MSPAQRLHDRAPTPQRASAWVAFALALLLVAAQTLGLWHRTEHAPASAAGLAAALPHGGDRAVGSSAIHHASLTTLVFGHAAGESAACLLFDQQSLADALAAVAAVLPLVEPVCIGVVQLALRVTPAEPAPYQARAPPGVG